MKDGTFTADRLLALYDRVAEAEDAIPRLRRFVLDLAVRGKLVEQVPTDEPAVELLEWIAKEKARHQAKPVIDIQGSDVPAFDIPDGWAWTTLSSVSTVTMGQSPPGDTYNTHGEGVPLINGPVEFTEGPFGLTVVNQYTTAPTNFCEKGDLLICVRGSTTGRTNVASFRACIGRGVAAIHSSFEDGFVRLFLWKARYDIIEMGRGIAFPSVSKKQIEDLAFPLPPVAEQQRIVAKVNELMALCDRLEAARAGRQAVRDRLTAATLARLTAPETDAETFPTHARFALQALPTLTTRPDQIKSLRQTILNLAVRGKLVAQDPTDEPAAELLKVTLGKKSALPKVGEEPFEVPHAWMWLDFEDVAAFENGDRGKNYPNRNEYKEAGIPWINTGHIQPDGSLSATGMHFISREKFNSLGGGKIRPGDMLYCLRGATFGKTAFVEPYEEGAIASSLMIIRPSKAVDRRFTYYYLTSPFGRSQLLRFDNGTAQPNLSSGNVKRYRFPLPPLAEQHRIVAKVDALMALCDQLEASLTTATTTRSRLLEALLNEALGGQTQAAA